jgi:tetratricopeptide (TPR) repeat protein
MHGLLFALAIVGSPVAYQDASSAALASGDAWTALATAEEGLQYHPTDAMLIYDRGCALASLGRTTEAVNTLRDAARRFVTARWRALAAYRAFLTLEQAGRCHEAAAWLERYARVAPSGDDVTMARNIGQTCRLEQERAAAAAAAAADDDENDDD